MSWLHKIIGSVSGNIAEVDTANQLKVAQEKLPLTNPGNVGAVKIYSEVDAGTLTGTSTLRSPHVSYDRRMNVGLDTWLFNDTFTATAQNTSLWEYVFATLTASQPGAGTVNFGTVQGTAATHGAFMRSYQHFPLRYRGPLRTEFTVGLFTATLVANEEWRCGLGKPTVAGTAPTDGIWFVLDTTNGLRGVVVYNGVSTFTATLASLASFTVGTMYRLSIVANERVVEFWREGILLGTLATPVGNGIPFQGPTQPVFMQKLCTGAVSNTNTVRVSDVSVSMSDLDSNKTWEVQLASAGQTGNIGQDGHTQGKTSLYANSTAPTAAALTNTTAAFTGLGGQAAVLPTLAVSSDGIIMAFQNPVPTINRPGRNLLVYGVWLESYVSVTLTGGPIYYQYCVAYGHTAVSLATAETGSFVTATTHAPRIVALGNETFVVTAAAGTRGQGVNKSWRVPLVVRPGEFFAITAKAGVGSTVTSLGAITYMIGVDAVWE